jgi:hypothetical protein
MFQNYFNQYDKFDNEFFQLKIFDDKFVEFLTGIYCEMRVSRNNEENSLTIIIPKSLNDENLSGIILEIRNREAKELLYFKNSLYVDENWICLIRESFFNNIFKWIIRYSTEA